MSMVKSKKIIHKIKSFYKRWNIPTKFEENQFEAFRNRVLNVVLEKLRTEINDDTDFDKEYLNIIGEILPIKNPFNIILNFNFKDTSIYKFLSTEDNFIKFVFKMEAFFWCDTVLFQHILDKLVKI